MATGLGHVQRQILAHLRHEPLTFDELTVALERRHGDAPERLWLSLSALHARGLVRPITDGARRWDRGCRR